MHGRCGKEAAAKKVEADKAATAEPAQETMAESAEAHSDAAARARAEAEAAERTVEALRGHPPQPIIPLRSVPPDVPVPPPEEIGRDPSVMEREGAT